MNSKEITEIADRIQNALEPYVRDLVAHEANAIRRAVREEIANLGEVEISRLIREKVEESVEFTVKVELKGA